jgi:hypothetical protein
MYAENVGDCIRYVVCFNCGRVSPEREFCIFCHMPLSIPPPQTNEGVPLGSIEDGQLFRLPMKYFGFHFAFYGVTGTGKTRAAMNLAIKAENEGLNLRVIDIEGEWKNVIPELKKDTVYYDINKNLKVNPFDLQDPGLTKLLLRETIFKGIELEYRDLSPQMNFMLDKCVLISKSIPKLIENVISHKPETEFPLRNLDLTRTALLTRLNPYKDNPVLRNIFYVTKSSIDMNSIKDKNLIIDLHGLDMKVAYRRELRLIYNTLAITYLREALKTEEVNFAKHLFVADEAQLLVPKILQKAVVTDTWATTDFATRLRKRGESLAIISQSPANIEDDIRKNSQNLFVFRLIDPGDIKAIAGMFGYVHVNEVNHLSSMLTSMEERCAMVKTPLTSYPFIIRTLDVELPKLTEKDLAAHLSESEETKEETLSEDEEELLQNIRENPFLNNTERALSLGWHRTRYSKARKLLRRRELVEEISFKTKIKGAPSHFLKLRYKEEYGRGQFIHAFWVNKIYDYLNEGDYKPIKEYKVDDKVVDIAYTKDGRLIFVEIEYKSDWKSNILRASKLCDRLVSVFVREKDIIEAMNFIKQKNLSNVTVTDIYYSYKVIS